MNHQEGISVTDPRLLAYALGEVADPAELARLEVAVAADPTLRDAVEQHRLISADLGTMFAREPLPYVNTDAIVARALGDEATTTPSSRRRSGGLGGSTGRIELSTTRRAPILFGFGAAAAACVAAFFFLRPAPGSLTDGPVTQLASEPKSDESSGDVHFSPTNAPRTLASLAAGLPVLPGVGSGVFNSASHGPVSLRAGAASAYTEAFVRDVTRGRRPPPEFTRLDGLVNTFVAGRSVFPGTRPVKVEAALTDAPWDSARRVLRVTVYAKGVAGEVAARRAGAEIRFDPAAVKSWRVLGYRDGSTASTTASLRAGTAVTTLYEIEPVAGSTNADIVADVAVRYSRVDRNEREVESVTVFASDRKALADTDSDTRFAAGLAAYAMNLGADPAAGLVAAAGEDATRLAFARSVR